MACERLANLRADPGTHHHRHAAAVQPSWHMIGRKRRIQPDISILRARQAVAVSTCWANRPA